MVEPYLLPLDATQLSGRRVGLVSCPNNNLHNFPSRSQSDGPCRLGGKAGGRGEGLGAPG